MSGLVLSRRQGQSIEIANGEIIITVVRIGPDRVRLLVDAPKDIPVHRQEIAERIREQGG